MIVDGKKIAATICEHIKSDIKKLGRNPVLAVITCAPNFETQKYLSLKKKKAAQVGITLQVVELEDSVTTNEAVEVIKKLVTTVDGIVVQLPFPSHIDREVLLAAVPSNKDPDGFSYNETGGVCLPPVVGAIEEIARAHNFDFKNKTGVVLGQGRLVGLPAGHFLRRSGANVLIITESSSQTAEALKTADAIVCGIGKPHFITVDSVKSGVIVFDAGTSEDGGFVVGDVHPDVAFKAALFTPVPGGIGPITIAVLLRNLVKLVRQEKNVSFM